MRTILVTYDLRKPGTSADYARLIAEIRDSGDVIRPLESVWLIRTGSTTEQIRNDLQGHIDANDGLLVWDVTGQAASWAGLSASDGTWIRGTP